MRHAGRIRIAAMIALLWSTCFLSRYEARSQTSPPSTTAEEVLKAFLSAFNSADRNRIEDYVNTYDATATADELLAFSSSTGGFSLLSIQRSGPNNVRFLLKGRSDGVESFGDLYLTSITPPRVRSLIIRALPSGVAVEDLDLTPALRAKTIRSIGKELADNYVYPAVARQMDQTLQDREHLGAYASMSDGNEFADALTYDLRKVSHDGHLFIAYSPSVSADENVAAVPGPAELSRYRSSQKRDNCSFSEVRILPRNIGYLKFNEFADPGECGPTVVAAFGFLAHADALIVDVRDNHGGQPTMVQLILSYFFSEPTHVNDIYIRPNEQTRQYWTLPYVSGPRFINCPLYVLTSRHTFSGAEEFTNDLKTQKRAVIVGETTGGGAHPLNVISAGEHFVIGIPIGRPINAITHSDWEGKGIAPDVEARADQALEVAQKLAEAKLLAH